jgi:hypothetical protein
MVITDYKLSCFRACDAVLPGGRTEVSEKLVASVLQHPEDVNGVNICHIARLHISKDSRYHEGLMQNSYGRSKPLTITVKVASALSICHSCILLMKI